ncbi:MAG: RNA-directed DNA polymerase, partial [Chromatiales bacterium]|nr:RNA-directed DNA polymerase [Chromatiales bacterium]
LAWHWAKFYQPPGHVFGFVPGRSHIQAAQVHLRARWTLSVDLEDFFPSTPQGLVQQKLEELSYPPSAASMLSNLLCFNGGLAQGAPTSPLLSNMAMTKLDEGLIELAEARSLRLSRYADDIVLSGDGVHESDLLGEIKKIVKNTPWKLSRRKTELAVAPRRRKVHGLLVHGERVRLTKGYRNKIRAYQHLLDRGAVAEDDRDSLMGHVRYAHFIEPLE